MPIYPSVPGLLSQIEHIIVLMFENRSFDHLLGNENLNDAEIEGVLGLPSNLQDPADVNSPGVSVAPATRYEMPFDPGHEFADVAYQIYAPHPEGGAVTMGGFFGSAMTVAGSFADAARVMEIFQAAQLPAFTALAREYATCNYWFSSLPGPTWPNRFFVHAATSGGLTLSPGTGQILDGFHFAGGTIYERLAASSPALDWRIYHDGLPQCVGIDWLRPYYIDPFTSNFRSMGQFSTDVANGDLPPYTFIEPRYDTGGNYVTGNSMHPLNDIRQGEALLKTVYDALRQSPIWAKSLLVVTFDEHGGFYDHVPPPGAVPTGDDTTYGRDFAFDRLGVRVPAIVVTPYTQRGSVVGVDNAPVFDHSSILKTVERRFNLPALTRRDAAASSLEAAFNTPNPRLAPADALWSLPDPVTDAGAAAVGISTAPVAAPKPMPLSDNQQSLVDLALRCNLDLHPDARNSLLAEHAAIKTQTDAAAYLQQHEAIIEAQRR